ncbi:hypothetical protein ACVALR_14105 [Stenotrophomonas maltophilia]
MYPLATAIISAFYFYKILRLLYLADQAGGVAMFTLTRQLLRWACLILALLLPIAVALFYGTAFDAGKAIPASRSMTPAVVISSLAGLVFAGLPLATLWRDYRDSRKVSFLAVGGNIALAAAGLLVCVAGYKHVQFASGEAGWADIEALHELNYAADVECPAGVVIVSWPSKSPSVPARYRCPIGFALGAHAQLPFVPWPDYQEGESLELAQALAELNSRTTR